MNYFNDNSEWKWLFEKGIEWDKILPLYYPSYPTEDGMESQEDLLSFFSEILSSTGEWAGTSVLELAEKLDQEGAGKVEYGRTIMGPALERLIKEASELQVFGLSLPRQYGGLQMPATINMFLLEQISRSCLSSSTQIAFFTSIAEMVDRYCPEDIKERVIPLIIEGKLSGSMNLTEPGAGSDLANIKTTATKQDNGSYLLNGSKIFITNGGGGVAFILAKVKGAEDGLTGISMFFAEQFIPEQEEPNWQVAKTEHKMGMHGSFTTEVVYENTVAHLVGVEGEGLKYMLHLMNEARIAVGFQALGGIEGCLFEARKYAEEREAFGKPISELPLMKRNLEDFETERDAIRALMVDTISHYDVFFKLDSKKWHGQELTEEEKAQLKEASLWTRKRTPLVKYYACEAYTHLSQRAIQVLGGYGFMKEYPLERYHRDSFGPLLYEGTSQIQALMALKDLMKYAMKDPKTFFSHIFLSHPYGSLMLGEADWRHDFKDIHYEFKKKMLALLISCLKPEGGKLFNLKEWTDPTKVDALMVHAETLCQGLSYVETLRVLCQHADIDGQRADLFNRYQRLVRPRLEAIYKDWEVRCS